MFTRTTALSALAGAALLAASLGAAAPASAKPVSSAFPATMVNQVLQGGVANYGTHVPTLMGGQYCDPANNPSAAWPKSSRSADYYNGSDDTSGLSASAHITTWRDAGQAFTDVVEDTGQCALFEDMAQVDWSGQPSATHALFANSDGTQATAVILDGRNIVSVHVSDWDGRLDEVAGATSEALKLAAAL